jgi:hypothetical protein
MVLALSEKQHKPLPAWYRFVRSVEESTYEEKCGSAFSFLPRNAPGNTEMERKCNLAAALKYYWNNEPARDEWYTLHEMATHPDSIATSEDMQPVRDRVRLLEDAERRMSTRRRWRDRSHRKPQRNARRNWKKVRGHCRLLLIVLYWKKCVRTRDLGLTRVGVGLESVDHCARSSVRGL